MEAPAYPIAHFEGATRLAIALKDLPAQILEHQYFYESFGSWHSVIRYKGRVYQLTYDGRDRYMSLRQSVDRKPPYVFGPDSAVGSGRDMGLLQPDAVETICLSLTTGLTSTPPFAGDQYA
jgi:hypothetical protein